MSAAQSHDEFSSSISKPHISSNICLPNRWRTSHQQHQTNPNHTISSFLLPTVSLLCCLCVQPVCWGCVIAVVCSNAMLSAPPPPLTHTPHSELEEVWTCVCRDMLQTAALTYTFAVFIFFSSHSNVSDCSHVLTLVATGDSRHTVSYCIGSH